MPYVYRVFHNLVIRYVLDGPEIESRWRRDFPNLLKPALVPTHPPVQWLPGLLIGGKVTGEWHWLPQLHLAAKLKKK